MTSKKPIDAHSKSQQKRISIQSGSSVFYLLVSEDLSDVGGPMRMNSPSENFREYFLTLEEAKKFAERDFAIYDNDRKIKWERMKDSWSSGDLDFVMYTITKEKFARVRWL